MSIRGDRSPFQVTLPGNDQSREDETLPAPEVRRKYRSSAVTKTRGRVPRNGAPHRGTRLRTSPTGTRCGVSTLSLASRRSGRGRPETHVQCPPQSRTARHRNVPHRSGGFSTDGVVTQLPGQSEAGVPPQHAERGSEKDRRHREVRRSDAPPRHPPGVHAAARVAERASWSSVPAAASGSGLPGSLPTQSLHGGDRPVD